MATADSQSQPGAAACAASEPVAVYRYSLRRRLLVVVLPITVTFGILWRPVFYPESGWRFKPPGVVEVGLLVGLCIAWCFLIVEQFSRFELYEDRLIRRRPLGLRSSTVYLNTHFQIEEGPAPLWKSLIDRELRITSGPGSIIVSDGVAGYWNLSRRLRTIQERREPSQHDPAESA